MTKLRSTLAALALLLAPQAHAATIDVLVTYTPAAQAKMIAQAGSVNTYATRMLDQVNRAFITSQVPHRVGLAGTRLFNGYDETFLQVDFEYFLAPGDGKLDQVHAWRTNLGGDVAVLVADYSPGTFNTGIAAAQPTRGPDDAFVACDVDRCMAGQEFVFAHEFGHLAGCGHQDQTAISTAAYQIPGTSPLIVDVMNTYGLIGTTRLLFYGRNIVVPNFYGMTNVRIGDSRHDCGGSWVYFGNVMSAYR